MSGEGRAVGQRRHAPFKLAIPLGAASVQAFKAAATAESIKSVELVLPNSAGKPVPFLMYPQGETDEGRNDSLDPASFRYTITSREITG